MKADLVIRNGTCVVEGGADPQRLNVAIVGDRIAALCINDALPAAERTIDATGRYVLPGFIDTHVHTRAPGYEHKEDFVTCSSAAAAGGITMFLAMFNVKPPTISEENCLRLIRYGELHSLVNFNIYGLVVDDNFHEIEKMASLGIASFKILMGYARDEAAKGLACPSDGRLLDAMRLIAPTGVPLAAHAENDDILHHRRHILQREGRRDAMCHLESRPDIAEAEAITRLVTFSRFIGNKLHILHLSSGAGMQAVLRAKKDGLPVTAETCPHYLVMTNEEHMVKYGSLAKINPPIRSGDDQRALWDGVECGGIDVIGTDHAPQTDHEKMLGRAHEDIWAALPGFAGVETGAPLLLTQMRQGRLSLSKLVEIYSTNAARIFGFYPDRGTLRVGSIADIGIWDIDREWTIERHSLHSKCTATPFHGWSVRGQPSHVIVNGTVVYADGEVVGRPGSGRYVPATHDKQQSKSSTQTRITNG